MIRSVTVTNYLGEKFKMELTKPELSGFVITSITGLGSGKATINMVDMATTDGSLYNSARVPSRNIVISVVFMEGKESIETLRQKCYRYFPIKKKLKLKIEMDNRIGEIEGYVESVEPDIFSDKESAEISIVCDYPFFYAGGMDNVQSTIFNGIEPMFEFPFSNESLEENLIEIGIIRNRQDNTVLYSGDVETGIIIYIHAVGKASNVTIYNTTTKEVMKIDTKKLEQLTGNEIIASDDIIINTIKGQKSAKLIREGVETNILNCIDRNVDWFQIVKGDNIFVYTAETGSENLQFKIENHLIYEAM